MVRSSAIGHGGETGRSGTRHHMCRECHCPPRLFVLPASMFVWCRLPSTRRRQPQPMHRKRPSTAPPTNLPSSVAHRGRLAGTAPFGVDAQAGTWKRVRTPGYRLARGICATLKLRRHRSTRSRSTRLASGRCDRQFLAPCLSTVLTMCRELCSRTSLCSTMPALARRGHERRAQQHCSGASSTQPVLAGHAPEMGSLVHTA